MLDALLSAATGAAGVHGAVRAEKPAEVFASAATVALAVGLAAVGIEGFATVNRCDAAKSAWAARNAATPRESCGDGARCQGENRSTSTWRERPAAIEANLGFGTPVGYAGVTLDYAVLESVSLNAGSGVGSGVERSSLHVAGGGRVRLCWLGTARLYLAAEYSTGGYRDEMQVPGLSGDGDPTIHAARIHWVEPSFGLEWRWPHGLTLRLFEGIGFMLNPGARRCLPAARYPDSPCAVSRAGTTISFTGLALGYAF